MKSVFLFVVISLITITIAVCYEKTDDFCNPICKKNERRVVGPDGCWYCQLKTSK